MFEEFQGQQHSGKLLRSPLTKTSVHTVGKFYPLFTSAVSPAESHNCRYSKSRGNTLIGSQGSTKSAPIIIKYQNTCRRAGELKNDLKELRNAWRKLETFNIMRVLFIAPLKSLSAVTVEWFPGLLNSASMMPKNASLSDSCTVDGCSFSRLDSNHKSSL